MLGTLKRRGMGCYLRNALKILGKTLQADKAAAFFSALLSVKGEKALAQANSTAEFKKYFLEGWSQNAQELNRQMAAYNAMYPVKLYKSNVASQDGKLLPQHLLPRHGELNALARVCVLMSDPQVQNMWNQVANESRLRAAFDDKAHQGLAVVNETIETTLLENFMNSDKYLAENTVNLSPYLGNGSVIIDPSKPPRPPKNLVWFREQRRYLRVVMAACMVQFAKKTGEGERGSDNSDIDTRFYKFCHGDMLLMFMWLHWGRGEQVPSHCSALLDEDMSFDTGQHKVNASPCTPPRSSGKKNGDVGGDMFLSSALKSISSFQDQILGKLGPSSTASCTSLTNSLLPEEVKARTLEALEKKIGVLLRVRDHAAEPQKQEIDKKVAAIYCDMLAV
jgi:hypothetical protein